MLKNFCKLIFAVVSIAINFTAAAQLPDSMQQKIQRATSPVEKFDAWYNAMRLCMQNGDLKTYELTTTNMLAIATHEKNDSLFMRTYSAMGFLFILKGDYKPGIEFLLKAMHKAEEIKDYEMLSVAGNNIGQAYLDLSNYAEALKYTAPGLKYSLLPQVQEKRPDLSIILYINLSEIFLKLNHPDSALRNIQTAHELLISYKTQQGRLSKEYLQNNLLMNFGMVYERLGENDLAENYYLKSIASSESQHFEYPLAQNTDKYGNFLFRQNRFKEAKEAALKCLQASEAADYKKGLIAAKDILRKVYFKLNHADSAYYYANINVNYRDTVYNEQKLNQL
jgi:tetratricopeptide (TPR) repeat protein